jgi:hypothetical protein
VRRNWRTAATTAVTGGRRVVEVVPVDVHVDVNEDVDMDVDTAIS